MLDSITPRKIAIVLGLLAFATIASSSIPMNELLDPRPADLDLSAIRYIDCDKWTGTGFLVADGVLVTALHVGSGTGCVDGQTGEKLRLYKKDEKHDLALMTGKLPTDIPYINLSCGSYKKNETYSGYGITDWGVSRPILRMNALTFTGRYTKSDFWIEGLLGGATSSPGLAIFTGHVAPGMSGGPVVDKYGYAHSLINAGSSRHFDSYEFKDTMLCQPSKST